MGFSHFCGNSNGIWGRKMKISKLNFHKHRIHSTSTETFPQNKINIIPRNILITVHVFLQWNFNFRIWCSHSPPPERLNVYAINMWSPVFGVSCVSRFRKRISNWMGNSLGNKLYSRSSKHKTYPFPFLLLFSDPDWIHSNNKYLENYVIKISIKIFNRFFSTFLCSTLFPPPPVLYPPPIQQLAACTSILTSRNKCETNKSINFLHLNHLGPNKLWKYTM